MTICSIAGCDRIHLARGLCNMHYLRRKNGTTMYAPATERNPEAKRLWIDATAASSIDECIDWPWANNGNGYGIVVIAGSNKYVHALVCEQAHGSRPAGMQAAHSCGRTICCNPRHLRWATPVENCSDRVIHGTHLTGERNPSARLTESDVESIRSHYSEGRYTQRELAEMFGVRQPAISKIIRHERWAS